MKLIKKFIKKVLSVEPPNDSEFIDLITKLKFDVQNIQITVSDNLTSSEKEWVNNRSELVMNILNKNPLKFLQWDVIKRTMVASYPQKFLKGELNQLKKMKEWDTRWKTLLEETKIGSPQRYPFYLSSSGNIIHQTFHISQYEKYTNSKINEYDLIFEFGGGYGAMCRLIHKLNFKGRYIIYDLPEFCGLQRFFLSANGLETSNSNNEIYEKDSIFHFDRVTSELIEVLQDLKDKNALFIANWSLSESPLAVRDLITKHFNYFSGVLVAYQHKFGEIDNFDYFSTFDKNFRKIDDWHNYEMQHMENNYYLLGSR